MNLLNFMYDEYRVHKPIRLIELFAGIGAQAKALENLGIDFEHYRICEFDKYAVSSYNAVHGTDFKPSDITKIHASDLAIVDTDTYEYIMTYSFPCQDLSLAGKGLGCAKGSGTRSGLLWEVERLLNECEELPQILLMENVPQVHGEKNKEDFSSWIAFLESKGYTCEFADLNAKNYGIPQNRDRCFMISILGHWLYEFPKPKKLDKCLADMLEHNVDEKYYLSDKMLEYIVSKDDKYKVNDNNVTINKSIACAVTTREGSTRADTSNYISKLLPQNYNLLDKCNCVGSLEDEKYSKMNESCRRVYGTNALSPTLNTCEGGGHETKILVYDEQNKKIKTDGLVNTILCDGSSPNHNCRIIEPKIRIKNNTKQGYLEGKSGDGVDLAFPKMNTRRGRVQKGMTQTLTCTDNLGVITKDYRIRKLTPLECWRLMGFDDSDFNKAQGIGMSNAQLYKQAGNSIVVNVLMAIFNKLL